VAGKKGTPPVVYVGDVDALKRSMAALPSNAQCILGGGQMGVSRRRSSLSTATILLAHVAPVAAVAAAGWVAYSYFYAADGGPPSSGGKKTVV